jgi:hypothetical protein
MCRRSASRDCEVFPRALTATNAAMFRQTPASQINDQLQNIERAKKSGAVTPEQAQSAAVNLLGGGVAGGGGSSEEEG